MTQLNPNFQLAYGGPARIRPTVDCSVEESYTQQQFKDDCDINKILAKFRRTGVLTHVTQYQPQYGEVPSGDYAEAMRTVATAQTLFQELPAHLRKEFNHDAEQFLSFVQNPDNAERAAELGLQLADNAEVQGAEAQARSTGDSGGPPAEPAGEATAGEAEGNLQPPASEGETPPQGAASP